MARVADHVLLLRLELSIAMFQLAVFEHRKGSGRHSLLGDIEGVLDELRRGWMIDFGLMADEQLRSSARPGLRGA